MLRIVISFVVAFAAAALGGKGLIPLLRRMKAGQSIKEIGPTWHMSKQGTPTMGGLMFIIGIGLTILVLGWRHMMAGEFAHLYVYLFALVFGAIGFIDDYQKVKHHHNTGLTALQKFALQLAAAVAFLCLMRLEGLLTPNLYIPFWNTHLVLPWPVYLIFAAFVIVGTVNAVQLLREKVKVKLDNDPENPQIYSTSDIKVIRSGKGKRPEGYVEPPLEELAKLRRAPEPEAAPEPTSSNPLAAALEAVFNGERPPEPEGERPRGEGEGRRRRRRPPPPVRRPPCRGWTRSR